jgi:uncharacterized membrane protein
MDTTAHSTPARPRAWYLERALFALAGTVTLVSVALGVLISPWFLLAAAAVGVSEWAFVLVGDCPASLLLRRFTSLRGCAR